MIAPMKKFLLVVLESDMATMPEKLAKLKVAHVEPFSSSGETCATLERKARDIGKALSILAPHAARDRRTAAAATVQPGQAIGQSELEAQIALILSRAAEVSALREKLSSLQREIDRIADWGEFDPALIGELRGAGICIRLFDGSASQREDIPEGVDYIAVSSPKGRFRLAVLGDSPLEGFSECALPEKPLSSLKADARAAVARLEEIEAAYSALAAFIPALEAEARRTDALLVLERMRSGLPGEERLRYLTGYLPAKEAPRFAAEARRHSWAVSIDDPEPEDAPPTKIENPPAVRIIQPVFDFLGTVPHYREYDISASFLVFFSFYFAMIFGDGGYGLLMLVFALIMSFKAKKSGRKLPDSGRLLYLLSGATILWGFLTSTWFALPYESLPTLLQNLSLTALNGSNPEAGTNTKILCFALGAIQLALAHLKNIRRDFPNLKFLAQIGSLALVVGMLNAVLNLVIDAARFPLYGASLALIAGGFTLVFVFGNWDGNLLKSIVEGLKGIIPTFLGTVSVFADIVSYIRLWAVGLAGLAISQTVNGMAIMLIGPVAGRIVAFLVGGLMALVLLLVGHSINFLMSVLSVIVHGIRLNMLEYSSHLGMEWSGYKYDPLGGNSDESNG